MPETCSYLHARSVSSSLRDSIPSVPIPGRVLAAFRRACVIQYGRDGLLALVAPDLGNGPLNIVVQRVPGNWSGVQPGMAAQVQDSKIQMARLAVLLDGADAWEPCPDWIRLRANAGRILNRLGQVPARLDYRTPGGSFLALLQDRSPADAVLARARQAAEALWSGWRGDEPLLSVGAAQLAGMGSGLTPSGDDFILGTMLLAWLAHPIPERYCATVLQASVQGTTTLSKAFLRSAAAGECSAPWHCLLEALQSGSDGQVGIATRDLLAYGHSSGADALAGFLWMGLRVLKG